MDIYDYLSKACTKDDVEIASKEEAIEMLSELHEKAGNIKNIKNFKEEVLKRESELSTELSFGVAIPHAKSKNVLRPALARLTLKEPIEWDNRRVSTVYLLASPDDKTHIEMLSALAESLQNGEDNV